ncbi:MAG TPA: cysteine desulfurase family protein [Rubricoccaceae bacterium]|nr:cysteine desulfurase family protein [Rubricoccaceae bacterium]
MRAPIYLDYNATTPCDPAVVEAMAPFFTEHFGNPSSNHPYGWAADEAVEQARERVAALLGAEPASITFTSGATEACALALLGAGEAYGGRKHHLVTVATEHKAVLESVAALEHEGFTVTVLPVDREGLLDLDRLRDAVTEKTLLVAVMLANNETGVIGPVAEAAAIAHEKGALVLTDATQAVGKIPVDVDALGADLLALSAHKFYGPKGVGALFVRRRNPRVRLVPLVPGGGQENGLRGGTLNVPGIVGLGKAAELASARLGEDRKRLARLRDRFEKAVRARVGGVAVNGGAAPRLPNTTNLRFDGITTAKLLPALRDVAASTGSACQVKTTKPSHVLTAMGLSREESFASVRFSLGRPTTEAEVDAAVDALARAVEAVRPARAA